MNTIDNESNIVNNSLPSAAEVVTDGGLATSRSNQQTLIRTERTPGMVAVSKPTQEERTEGNSPCLPSLHSKANFSAEASQQIHTKNNSENCEKTGYIPHWNSLVSLLQPEHPYFADKLGSLNGFYSYSHKDKPDGKVFLYPVMAKHNRENPYHYYLAARSHTGRTMGQLRSVIETNNLEDFRQLDLVMTFPREISEQLAILTKEPTNACPHPVHGGKGRDIAWNCWRKLWTELPAILGIDGDLAGMTNLHIWKTETPLNPHFHFHVIILNHYRAGDGDDKSLVKWFGFGINKTYVNKDGKKRTGPVPLSDRELEVIKQSWTKIVRASCKRNKIKCSYLDGTVEADKLLNLYVDYVKWDMPSKFIHKLNYQRRHWIEDYVKFTEKYPDCPNPLAWLEHYSNTVRVFGWWKQLKAFGGDKDLDAEPKIDFNTGEELAYEEHITNFSEIETLPLFCYDCYKGHPVISALDSNDIAWLKGCFEKDMMDKYGPAEGDSNDYGSGGKYDVL
jgi:hypothetical protein